MKTVDDVVNGRLCSGCGACAGMHAEAIEMADVPGEGRRPRAKAGVTLNGQLREGVAVCPGVSLEHDYDRQQPGLIRDLEAGWGPVLGLWEGHSTDPAIRHAGSSGGGVTAIALYMLERGDIHGVIHTAARTDKPYLNETVLSRSRNELLARTGSRYAPASPADGIPLIKAAPKPCVFIGKPCDVAAIQKARRIDPQLDAKLALTIGFFCAGTPSTDGTLAMLQRMGIDEPDRLVRLRYRGHGWPGKAMAVLRRDDGGEQTRELTYDVSWGEILTKHVQWRCRVCADHTGEFADVAVGDPWYRTPQPGETGDSLVLARTALGRQVIQQAMAAGYLDAQPREPGVLSASQPNLLHTRGSVWGRLLASRLVGAAAPRYRGLPLFRWWWKLPLRAKASSLFKTARKLAQKRREQSNGTTPS